MGRRWANTHVHRKPTDRQHVEHLHRGFLKHECRDRQLRRLRRHIQVTTVGVGSPTITITGAGGRTASLVVTVPSVGAVDIFPNDELDYPKAQNKLPNCRKNQPWDPNDVDHNLVDPDAMFVQSNQLSFDANGCELMNGNPVNMVQDYSIHIHETGFYGLFTATTDGNCGTALSDFTYTSQKRA